MSEIPVRFPPQRARATRDADGTLRPVMEKPVVECGMVTRLSGELVVCIRRAGHPVYINYAHSNGYKEWAFDEPALIRDAAGEWVDKPSGSQ